jgi:hypothetical protein
VKLSAREEAEVRRRIEALRVEVVAEYDVLVCAELRQELRDFEDVLRLHKAAVASEVPRW